MKAGGAGVRDSKRHLSESAERARAWASTGTIGAGPINRVAVLADGATGIPIVCACLASGINVSLVVTEGCDVPRMTAYLNHALAAQGVPHEGRMHVTTELDGAIQAQVAIEALDEGGRASALAISHLDSVLPADAVLATFSFRGKSDLPRTPDRDPRRVVGLYFLPVHGAPKLAEIVLGDFVSPAAMARLRLFIARLALIPILFGSDRCSIGARLQTRLSEAADTLLMDGTNPWELDEAMVAFGYATGHYEAEDQRGLDAAYAERRRQDGTRDPNSRYIPISDRMVEEGRLGRKAGVGWYRYPGGGGKVVDPLIEDLVREEAHFAKVTRRDFTEAEIQRRLNLALINEAAMLLEEYVAGSPEDIDLVSVFGMGFPSAQGGLMRYADTLGLPRILADLTALCAEDPHFWRPNPVIERLASCGGGFHEVKGP